MILAILNGLLIGTCIAFIGAFFLLISAFIIDDIEAVERNHEYIAEYMRNMR